MAVLLKTGTEIATIIHPADGDKFTLKELQGFVGGYIEQVTIVPGVMVLIVNEEGRLHDLPYNFLATNFYGEEIVGNAVLCMVRGEDYV
jgi:uncharacterized protein DUF3846